MPASLRQVALIRNEGLGLPPDAFRLPEGKYEIWMRDSQQPLSLSTGNQYFLLGENRTTLNKLAKIFGTAEQNHLTPEAHATYAMSQLNVSPAFLGAYLIYEPGSNMILPGLILEDGGLDLHEVCRSKKKLSLRQRVDLIEQMFLLSQTMFHHGWSHGDITPKNIVVQNTKKPIKVRFIDFSHSKKIVPKPVEIGDPHAFGTLGFRAPKDLVPLGPFDPRWDVFSLGVTCYFTLAHEYPFSWDLRIKACRYRNPTHLHSLMCKNREPANGLQRISDTIMQAIKTDHTHPYANPSVFCEAMLPAIKIYKGE